MQIEIEGSRTSDEAWRQAYAVSVADLFERTKNDIAWSSLEDKTAEQLARRLVAVELTDRELLAKCKRLGRLASNWLDASGQPGDVSLVRLRCIRGIFDLQIVQPDEIQIIEVREQIVDDLLQAGSREAAESLQRLFAANMGKLQALKAS